MERAKYALVGTHEALKLLLGDHPFSIEQWTRHHALWVYNLVNGADFSSSKFPSDVELVVLCDDVSYGTSVYQFLS
jgi:hypothetical protein